VAPIDQDQENLRRDAQALVRCVQDLHAAFKSGVPGRELEERLRRASHLHRAVSVRLLNSADMDPDVLAVAIRLGDALEKMRDAMEELRERGKGRPV